MGSRIRDNVRHFFECFCEIVPKKGFKEPWIIQKFPESYKDEEILKSVTSFAYPCEFENASVQHYSFVLTNIDSKWTFGFCRHDPYTETALVVLTFLPWHGAFRKFLDNIAGLTNSPKSEELWDFLNAAYNSRVPDPGMTYHVTYNQGKSTFTCQSPCQFQLPSIPENRNLTEYYNAVDSHNMMVIFASMLYERRIIFTSKKLDRLSSCVQSANDIIYPMIWQHIFIPVLPMQLKDYLLAPMPFLIGVPEPVFKQVRRVDVGEVVILDADNNTVETPFDDLESLPQEIVTTLKRTLRNRAALLGDGVSRAFLRALVQLIGGYRDAVRFSPGQKITFNPDAFVESRSTSMQAFLKKMLQLQIFQQFIEERLQMLNSGLGFSDEFEKEACKYSEKSSSKFKQQYKEFIKSVKDKANPAMKSAVKSVRSQVKEGGKGMKSAYKGLRSKFRDNQSPDEMTPGDELPYSRATNEKPRSAPNSPNTSRRKPIAKTTYRRVQKTTSELRSPNYTPLSPPSNPGSPDSPELDHVDHGHNFTHSLQLSPINMDLLHEMQDVLYKRHIYNENDGENTPPVDRSLKPVRSLESFKQDKTMTDYWWGSGLDTTNPTTTSTNPTSTSTVLSGGGSSTSPFRGAGAAIRPNRYFPESDSISQNLLDSFESPNSFDSSSLLKLSNNSKCNSPNLFDDSNDDVFGGVNDTPPPPPPVPTRKSSKDLFGATPFVVSGCKSENGDPVFLVASPHTVDMVKISPPPSMSFTSAANKNKDSNNDLIRLDSTPSDSIDDFDPLLSSDRHKSSSKNAINQQQQRIPPATVEKGLSNPLYTYFVPPLLNSSSSSCTSATSSPYHQTNNNINNNKMSNNDQDLLNEYGLDFKKFSLNSLQNGGETKLRDPFDPFDNTNSTSETNRSSSSSQTKQWTKFE